MPAKMPPFFKRLKRVGTAVIRVGLCAFAFSLPIAALAQQDEIALPEKLRAAASALRAEGVKLSDADFNSKKDAPPPPVFAAAGPEFVAAWKEYRRCLSIRTNSELQPAGDPKFKNAFAARDEYQRLLHQLVTGDTSPTPEDFTRFSYHDYSWCGEDVMNFVVANQRAILLACLRHRRFGEAVKMVVESTDEEQVREDLLTALGFDWHKVLAGAWLDGKWGSLESLCQNADDDTAQLVLRWSQLHWDGVVAKRGTDRQTLFILRDNTPQLPSFELLELLSGKNTVTDPTKQRIADFLNTNGTRLYDIDKWINRLSRGPHPGASWLKPMLRVGLQYEKNEVRKLAEQILHELGELDAKAELRAPPSFRLFVNHKAWPGFVNALLRPGQLGGFRPNLELTVKYLTTVGTTAAGANPEPNREGIIEPDADLFSPPERVRLAEFCSYPTSVSSESANPDVPWIRAEIPLPPAFGTTTDIRVETVAVTIQAHFPRPFKEYKDKVTWVEFGFQEDEPSRYALSRYRITGGGPLVLRRVQPGDYLVRVLAPGVAQTPLQSVHVTPATTRIEPKVAIGATVTVPLAWGDGIEIRTRDPELEALFFPQWVTGDRSLIRVERDGTLFTDLVNTDLFPTDEQRDKVILSNLPTGKYIVRLRSSDDMRRALRHESTSEGARVGWKKGEVSFEVTAKSPAEFTAPPLRIDPS